MSKIISTIAFSLLLAITLHARVDNASIPPPKPVVLSEVIYATFGEKAPLMTAIFKAESGLNATAVGYNCSYGICRRDDRVKALSVDCGVAQINSKGNRCPKVLFDIQNNISTAKEKLDNEGLKAWTVYRNGSYKIYLVK